MNLQKISYLRQNGKKEKMDINLVQLGFKIFN